MAMFFPGVSKCALTGRTLGVDDEVAFFPPFLHPDPMLESLSDGVIDFASVGARPEYVRLVKLYASFIEGKKYLFRNRDGALVELPFGQVRFVHFPLLLSIDAPELSLRRFVASRFLEESIGHGRASFEDLGIAIEYESEQLTIQCCPTKYVPSKAPPELIQRIKRKGRGNVEAFFRFIGQIVFLREQR